MVVLAKAAALGKETLENNFDSVAENLPMGHFYREGLNVQPFIASKIALSLYSFRKTVLFQLDETRRHGN